MGWLRPGDKPVQCARYAIYLILPLKVPAAPQTAMTPANLEAILPLSRFLARLVESRP